MAQYLKAAVRLSLLLSILMPSISLGERLQPSDLVYQGAFRLPEEFNWGARGLSYYPPGNSGAGSLLVTGFEALTDGYAEYGEVFIPAPQQEANWEDLPMATFLRAMTTFDGGLIQAHPIVYAFVAGIQYVRQQGSQTSDKIYGSLTAWYAEGEFGEDSFPTIWFSALNGTSPRGLFFVGPQSQTAPYHGRKMGAYLFAVPQWYADSYLGGRTLVTGRSRGTPVGLDEVTTAGGSQGPTLFACQPWQTDNPANSNLDAIPILYYRVKFPGCAGPNVGNPAQCDYPNFTMCDEWSGGAFVDNGSRQAILLLGYKGLGNNCYDEPPVECNDPCSDSHGYHCHPYERQIIFYDVDELGENVSSVMPWNVLPYAIWRPEVFFLQGDEQGNVCGDMGGMAVDPTGGRLFMVERGLGGTDTNAAVVHVWTFSSSSCPPCPSNGVITNAVYREGTTCTCTHGTAITLGGNVTVESGATVTFIAPTVTIQSGFHAISGSTVIVRQDE